MYCPTAMLSVVLRVSRLTRMHEDGRAGTGDEYPRVRPRPEAAISWPGRVRNRGAVCDRRAASGRRS
ncbi:hypothetical protein SCWH03_02550 [Streptomyces pacificus]|uniref:Uncharacterized protein n=1 Tax=Streptomyces pacificus TaxID=2705029 RepID=A0A6A0AM63_9ACTN|nr:hypothetical protein SCWH03_02550 [Streptomyces pacificus]